MNPKPHPGKSDLHEKLGFSAEIIELVLGIIILIGCVVTAAGILFTTDFGALFREPSYLQSRLSDACLVIIGIELITMITSYSIDSVVDVMLLAIARQMIVEHTAPLENLLAVAAVGLLFVIRKYLYISQIDRRHPSKKEVNEALRAQVFGFDPMAKEENDQSQP